MRHSRSDVQDRDDRMDGEHEIDSERDELRTSPQARIVSLPTGSVEHWQLTVEDDTSFFLRQIESTIRNVARSWYDSDWATLDLEDKSS